MSTIANDTYWLSRTGWEQTEGPFTLRQLEAMYAAGAVTAESLVCREGQETWTQLEALLAKEKPVSGTVTRPGQLVISAAGVVSGQARPGRAISAPVARPPRAPQSHPPRGQPDLAAALARRDSDAVHQLDQALVVMCVMIWLFALIPGVGLLAWLGAAFVGFAGLIIGVVMIARGHALRGIFAVFFVGVILPGGVLLANLAGTGIFAAWSAESEPGVSSGAAPTARE